MRSAAFGWVLGAACSTVITVAGGSQVRAIPFWPDAVPAAIHSQIDGVAVLETVRELSRWHRVHASPGYAAAAEHLRHKLLTAGLGDAIILRFAADGTTRYAHVRSNYGWAPVAATLDELEPTPRQIASFASLPVALADHSQDADVTAELVDVGDGTNASDYRGKDVVGKIVLASGPTSVVHQLAVEERGAAGVVSDTPNQRTAWSGEDRDLVRWGHLASRNRNNRFAFMVSKRQSDLLRTRMLRRERIVLRARVTAKVVPATEEVVSAAIPGTDSTSGEIVLSAHLNHQSAGANDNGSGSAAIFEIARALEAAIARGSLPRPARTIRFLWVTEMSGTHAFLVSHPEITRRIRAGINMDMVGGTLQATHGTLHISRSAESLPHVANAIAEAWFDQVIRASGTYAERGGDPYDGFVWPGGTRELFLADMRQTETGSDHDILQNGTFGVPTIYFHDWPDVTIHTNRDQPENLDVTKLGRVAYLGAGIAYTLAALPSAELPRLLAVTRAGIEQQVSRARLRGTLSSGPDSLLFEREAVLAGIETLQSVERLWPSAAGAVGREIARWQGTLGSVRSAVEVDPRRPVRTGAVRGRVTETHLDEILGKGTAAQVKLAARPEGELLMYETLNFVDGRRTVSEIRNALSGRYTPIPLAEVAEYLEVLQRAGAIEFAAGAARGPIRG